MKKLIERGFSALSGAGKIMKTTFLCVAATVLLGLVLSAGCGDDDEPFLIGYSVPTIPAVREVNNAIKFAEADINAAGGNVRLVDTNLDNERDGGTDPVNHLRKFMDMGIKGLIGPAATRTITDPQFYSFVTESKLVAVTWGSPSGAITDLNKDTEGQHYFFRTIPTSTYIAEVLAQESEGKVAIIYRDSSFQRDYVDRIEDDLKNSLRHGHGARQPPLKIAIDFRPPQNPPLTDAEARALVRTVEQVDGIRDVDSIIILMWSNDLRIITHLRESTVIPADAKYYLGQVLSRSDHLHSFIAKENEDPESDEVKARLDGFTGVITYPHSSTHSQEDLREFECRFDHSITHPEEDLLYTTFAYDAVVVMALAALKAGSTDPSVYVREVAGVTRGGTLCSSYAECRGLLTDDDPSNDDIDYDGLSGPLELDPETGDVTDAFIAVYTYDGKGSRVRDFDEVRDGEIVQRLSEHEEPERPLRECDL